ncbi:uncharacterized protein LOC130678158 [Microplitis mediator]|uniref:uncharacterized protein LOC130678158 n=1 Tax=Microplitis mediator TaxID=375433 RepID=UPI00255524E0|nr:uncharacterized protein LOC130678158 [Microplitis mediator]
MECFDTDTDPNSVRICRPKSLDIASVEGGSPVIDNNYTIYGFIEKECKIINKFHQIAPYFEGINAIINRDLNRRQLKIKEITRRFTKSAIIITKDDDNGCLGVPITQRHIIYSKLCNKIDSNAQVGSIFVASFNWDANTLYRPVKKRREFGGNFILLTLENDIEKTIPLYKLPSVQLQSHDELLSFGYTASCYNDGEYSQEGDDPFFRKTVYYDPSGVLTPRQYLHNHYLFQYSYYLQMSKGSPIVNRDNNIIFGFAEFECATFGSFKSILNYSLSITDAVLQDSLNN